jgi:hypothetical protein
VSNIDSKQASNAQDRFKKSSCVVRLLRIVKVPSTFSTTSTHIRRSLTRLPVSLEPPLRTLWCLQLNSKWFCVESSDHPLAPIDVQRVLAIYEQMVMALFVTNLGGRGFVVTSPDTCRKNAQSRRTAPLAPSG